MGFLSYSLAFYERELQKLAAEPPNAAAVYRARQLLKLLDDLADEGYYELNERLETVCKGVSLLRAYLRQHQAAPFPLPPKETSAEQLPYAAEEIELCDAVDRAMAAAERLPETAASPFPCKLREFGQWLKAGDGTARIFLLRDTLLPFVYARSRGEKCIYPWLLSRKAFASMTGRDNADDGLRAAIYRALEAGCTDFPSFARLVLPDMRETAGNHPQAAGLLRSMLEAIDAEKILVVESGCCGTFPLLLMSLDDRVDMRLYTTYPYLADVYAGRIYTARYEENRLFETMTSQEMYFRFSGLRNGRFYVRKCTDPAVERRALDEIKQMLIKQEENP